ncbi:Uncharacterized protein DAT39_017969, partial [Clarias magur]
RFSQHDYISITIPECVTSRKKRLLITVCELWLVRQKWCCFFLSSWQQQAS